MTFRVKYRRYRLPFRSPVRTAHGSWPVREGLLLRLEDETGRIGFGEAAPIPEFGTETVTEDEEGCHALGGVVTEDAIGAIPARLGCLRNALASARAEVSAAATGRSDAAGQAADPPHRAIAALLPAGKAALARIPELGDAGFRVFKWKVGVGDVADELALLDDVCAALPGGSKLRLDANGAWDRRRAERWLERCAERPVEFVEQPCFAPAAQGTAAVLRTEDLLLGLAGDFPTPIALDESLVRDGDLERWLGAGWPGVFVVKPSLFADPTAAVERLAKRRAAVVFSSALETAVGARIALRLAFKWRGEARALGFGVWPLFADARFDGPAVAPFVRWEDVRQLSPEVAWNALS